MGVWIFASIALTLLPLLVALWALSAPPGRTRTVAGIVAGIIVAAFLFGWAWILVINPLH